MAKRTKRKQRGVIASAEPAVFSLFDDAGVIDMNDAPDEFKLSAKLIEIMEPWLEKMDITILANCASLAWNAAVSGVDSYTNQDFLRNGDIEDNSAHSVLIARMKARKNKLFPNDMRTVLRMQVRVDEAGDPTIVVKSELKPENMLKMVARLASLATGIDDEDL